MAGYKKKLIEVALPLDEINKACHKENNVHTGLPSNLHTWWSRKPLGVARAIIFASLVDDPGEYLPEPEATAKREELFSVVARLADIDNGHDRDLLDEARREITRSLGEDLPTFWDPFCGGGSLPLEALRLGLPSLGTDLNPVAVFITRVLISLAPPHAYHAPINPDDRAGLFQGGARFEGLKRDVEYYSSAIWSKLSVKMQRFYPDAEIPSHLGGGTGKVASWIWSRTVTCPNPSCMASAPLVNKFWLSTHVGNEAYAAPVFDKRSKTFSFEIRRSGEPLPGTVNRSGATCLACGNPISFDHIRSEGAAGRIKYSLMAIAVENPRGRLYLEPTSQHVAAAEECVPEWEPDTELPDSALGFRVQKYGITNHRDLFTQRQMAALSELANEIGEIRERIVVDADGDASYANLVHAFLAISLSRLAQTNNTLVRWRVRTSGTSKGEPAFDRQIVSMVWEFSEGNVLGNSVGSWKAAIKNPLTALNSIPATMAVGEAIQHNASSQLERQGGFVISTDPPYFDAIGYADLSDFFYIWLRKAMGGVHRDIFGTMLVPKSTDLTCDLGRKSVPKKKATQQFLERLHGAFKSIFAAANENVPITVYYAFKQAEVEGSDTGAGVASSTGWETLLEGLIGSGFQITGTWPLRTESANRLRAIGSNALASSIVLVCRKRTANAPGVTKTDFVTALRKELPDALKGLQKGNIAPVDLAQASIGPGMEIFSRYSVVIESDDSRMSVKSALQLINQCLDEYLSHQEGEYDPYTRFAITWFENYGMEIGVYGDAETIATARGIAVNKVQYAGLIESKGGRVRLLNRSELEDDWTPASDTLLTVWEATQYLIRTLERDGEVEAAALLRDLGPVADFARDLAYRLYGVCEKRKWAEEGLAYNNLVLVWPELTRLAASGDAKPAQGVLI